LAKNTAAQIINTLAVKANIAEVKKQGEAVKDTSKEIIENTNEWNEQTASLLAKLLPRFKPLLVKLTLIVVAIGILI
jgi:hypothetical protein